MAELRVLIAAAGAGKRAALPYPKTLHPVRGQPILGRLLRLTAPWDAQPTVIVSPGGRAPIADFLTQERLAAHLVEQAAPRGMGDAVLQFRRSPAAVAAHDVLLIWGDIPLLSGDTVAETIAHHRATGAALTFPTRHVADAYTRVVRDQAGHVIALEETRELGVDPTPGERDVGVFVFTAGAILDLLAHDLPQRIGRTTGEHGFLHVVALAVAAGLRVDAPAIARADDLISLNRLADLQGLG